MLLMWTHMVWKTGQVKFLVLRQDRTLTGTAGRRGNSFTLNQSAMKLGSFRCSWGKVGGSFPVKICRNSEANSLKFYGGRKQHYSWNQQNSQMFCHKHESFFFNYYYYFPVELTASASSVTSELRRPASSCSSLMTVCSVRGRPERAAQCRTLATFATASDSCRQQIRHECAL